MLYGRAYTQKDPCTSGVRRCPEDARMLCLALEGSLPSRTRRAAVGARVGTPLAVDVTQCLLCSAPWASVHLVQDGPGVPHPELPGRLQWSALGRRTVASGLGVRMPRLLKGAYNTLARCATVCCFGSLVMLWHTTAIASATRPSRRRMPYCPPRGGSGSAPC
jgi:hypothetical protein